MINPKPFRTVDEQVAILEARGVLVHDESAAAEFLLRENYYAVVNGYKDAFLDRQATNLAGEDRYKSGATFEGFQTVYRFDKALRDETMSILLEAEAAMKTATVYAFCSVHGGPDDYLDPSCYCSKQQYRPEWRYTKGLIRLLSILQGIRDNRLHKPYIKHYTNGARRPARDRLSCVAGSRRLGPPRLARQEHQGSAPIRQKRCA